MNVIDETIDATLDSNGQLRLTHQPRLRPGPVRVTIRVAAGRSLRPLEPNPMGTLVGSSYFTVRIPSSAASDSRVASEPANPRRPSVIPGSSRSIRSPFSASPGYRSREANVGARGDLRVSG
jgi:hypothetical protein